MLPCIYIRVSGINIDDDFCLAFKITYILSGKNNISLLSLWSYYLDKKMEGININLPGLQTLGASKLSKTENLHQRTSWFYFHWFFLTNYYIPFALLYMESFNFTCQKTLVCSDNSCFNNPWMDCIYRYVCISVL